MSIFEQQGLKPEILRAITDLGYVNPTPIQEKTIPAIMNTKADIIALAQTGTGKTAGFGLPILNEIDLQNNQVQAIILSPTRELCLQICNDLQSFAKYMPNVNIEPVYGGAPITNQIQNLRRGAHIVVGTPGRTLDLISRKALKINNIRWVVLDEADEMLNMGFRDDLDAILENTPSERQTLLFSATMPQGVREIAANYMNSPEEISSGKQNTGADNVQHYFYMVRAHHRYPTLKRLADINPNIYGIVFCRTRHETKEIASKLMSDGYNADALHGDLSQAQRDQVMQRFRERNLQLLVATDVAARGIDITDLTHVINYNLPDDPEVYVHRSGRTGRAGRSGQSLIITHTRDGRKLKAIEKMVGKKFQAMPVPTGKEICEKRLFSLMDNIEKMVVDENQIAPFLPVINKKLEWMDRDQLLKRLISFEFNHFLEYYKNAEDFNVAGHDSDRGDRGERSDRSSDRPERGRRDRMEGSSRNERRTDDRGPRDERRPVRGDRGGKFTRFFINLGDNNGVKAHNLIGLLNEKTKMRNLEVGKIEILRNFSFFEVESGYEKEILQGFNNSNFGGTELKVEVSKPERGPAPERGGYGGSGGSGGYGGGDRFGKKKSRPEKSPFTGKDKGKRRPKRD
jgi:ATP-dependent RNA helicase DeaD